MKWGCGVDWCEQLALIVVAVRGIYMRVKKRN